MIVCSKCGKENQDHYKFCLGCGSELSGPAPAPAPVVPAPPRKTAGVDPAKAAVAISPTPPAGVPQVNPGRRTASPSAQPGPVDFAPADAFQPTAPDALTVAEAPAGMANCPGCGSPNPKEFVFCGNCGGRLQAQQPPRTMNLAAKKAPPAAQEARALAKLALIRPDGSEGGIHTLRDAETVIGRGTGPLFDHDSYLSPTHARVILDANGIILEDVGSLNGVFVKITAEEMLRGADIFRIGQELLRFDPILEPQLLEDGTEIMGSPNPGYWGRLSVIMGPGIDGSAFPLMGEEMVLGRERGDILFSDDGYVSGTHAKISVREDGYFLTDLGSSNGTFVRLIEPRVVPSGTFVLMGQQLFRIEQL